MSDTLSQEEIDALREAVKSGSSLDGGTEEVVEQVEQIKVTTYNFRKPHLLSGSQLRTLQLLHEAFGKGLQSDVFSFLKASMELKLVAIDQLNYSEFVLSVASPTYVALFKTKPDIGSVAIEINASIIMPMLDILLGGDGSTAIEPRELTSLEVDMFNSVIGLFLEELKAAWAVVTDVEFEMVLYESNVEYLQMATPETSCMNVAFDVHIGDATGVINICYPFNMIQSAMKRGRGQAGAGQTEKKGHAENEILKALSVAPLDVSAIIGASRITAQQLGQLKIGDVICMDRRYDSSVDIFVEKKPFYSAALGKRRNKVTVDLIRPYGMEKFDSGNSKQR